MVRGTAPRQINSQVIPSIEYKAARRRYEQIDAGARHAEYHGHLLATLILEIGVTGM
jgi:hypothetical protein